MKKRNYIVLAGGDIAEQKLTELSPKNAIILAADSGAEAFLKQDRLPDLLIGDLDSIGERTLDTIIQKGETEIFRFPAEKDASDTYLALEAIRKLEQGGYKKLCADWSEYRRPAKNSRLSEKWDNPASYVEESQEQFGSLPVSKSLAQVTVFGASGSRLDHSLANYAIAFSFLKDMTLTFVNENEYVYPAIGECKLFFAEQRQYPYFSIFPFSEELQGLSLTGFYYPLTEANIRQENASLLLSNHILSQKAELSLKKGKCLILQSRDG